MSAVGSDGDILEDSDEDGMKRGGAIELFFKFESFLTKKKSQVNAHILNQSIHLHV